MSDAVQTFSEQLTALAAAALLSTLALLLAFLGGYFKFIPLLPTVKYPSFKAVFAAFVIYFFIEILMPPALLGAWFLWQNGHFPTADEIHLAVSFQGWLTLFTMCLATAVLIFYTWTFDRGLRKDIWNPIRLNATRIYSTFLITGVTWLISYPVMILLGQGIGLLVSQYLGGHPEPLDQVAVKYLKTLINYPALFWGTIVAMVLVIPIAEEILFRGLLQNALKKYLSRYSSVVLASVLFALLHYSYDQGFTNWELLTSLFVFSCFLGLIYERQQTLWASISLHSLFNLISVLLIILKQPV